MARSPGPSFRRLTSAVSFLYIISLPLLWSAIDLLDAVTALVIYIQIYSLIHVKRERNYDHIILMSFFLLLASAVMTPSPAIGLVFIAYIVVSVWAFVLLEMYSAAQRSGAADDVDIVNLHEHTASLEILQRRWIDLRSGIAIAAAAIAAVIMSALIFFMSPRMEAGILGARDPQMFQTGLSEEVNLAAGGMVALDTTAVMRVTLPELDHQLLPAEMYWRNTTFDFHTGAAWVRRGVTTFYRGAFPPMEYRRFTSRGGQEVEGGVFRLESMTGRPVVIQEIFLDAATNGPLPALPLVQSIEPNPGQKGVKVRWDQANDFTVEVNNRSGGGVYYRAWSELTAQPTSEQLRDSSVDYPRAMNDRDYELLTSHNLTPRTVEVARAITENAASPYDKVVALEQYLSGPEFQYTLDVPEHSARTPVDDFILNTKKGHCQLFGSALALMARSQGIPARVVNGYRGGRFDSNDKSYTVTADMAHLWVEVFFPDFGWVIFDPSPPNVDSQAFTIGMLRRELSRVLLKGKLLWYQNIVGFTPQTRFVNLRNITIGLFRSEETPLDTAQPAQAPEDISLFGHLMTLLPLAAALAAVIFAAFMILRLVVRARRPVRVLTTDQLRARRLRNEVGRRLRAAGVDTKNKSVDELRQVLAAQPWNSPEDALQVLAAYNAVRFGARELPVQSFGTLLRMARKLRPAQQPH